MKFLSFRRQMSVLTVPGSRIGCSAWLARLSMPGEHLWSGVLVRKRRGQFAVGLTLDMQRVRLGLERLHGVGAGSKAGRRLLERDELHEGVGELGGVATLLPVHALPCGNDLPGSVGVVVNGGLSVGRRVVGE